MLKGNFERHDDCKVKPQPACDVGRHVICLSRTPEFIDIVGVCFFSTMTRRKRRQKRFCTCRWIKGFVVHLWTWLAQSYKQNLVLTRFWNCDIILHHFLKVTKVIIQKIHWLLWCCLFTDHDLLPWLHNSWCWDMKTDTSKLSISQNWKISQTRLLSTT